MDKICINCKYIMNIHHVDKHWCCLKDEPVNFDEYCSCYKKKNKMVIV